MAACLLGGILLHTLLLKSLFQLLKNGCAGEGVGITSEQYPRTFLPKSELSTPWHAESSKSGRG